jgi:hypothetical protein
MTELDIQKREVPRIVYFVYCLYCSREIKGASPLMVEKNLDMHLTKCKKEKKNGRGEKDEEVKRQEK